MSLSWCPSNRQQASSAAPNGARARAAWLLSTPLGQANLLPSWSDLHETLSQQGFPLWRDWYERRITGHAQSFALPPAQDAEMARRLIAQDDDWWKREPAIVNAEIQGWLDELTPDEETGFLVPELSQNPRVPRFEDAGDDQLGIADEASEPKILTDEGARRRHALVRVILQRALQASALGETQSIEVGHTISDCLDALGSSPETMQPEAYVVFSKALRREMADLLSGKSLRPPLSERQTDTLETWLDSDAVLIGMDEWLAGVEKAIYERRFGPVQIERDALRQLIAAAKESGVPNQPGTKILEAAAAIVPEGTTSEPDAQIAAETTNNFFRSVARKIERLWNFGEKAGPRVLKLAQYVADHADKLSQQFPVMKPIWDFIKDWFGSNS